MKKILFINGIFPLPENCGSNQRSMQFIKFFQKIGAVDLVYSEGKKSDQNVSNMFRKVYYFGQMPGEDSPKNIEKIRMYFNRYPHCIRTHFFKSYYDRLISLLNDENYDLIFVRYIFNAQYLLDINSNFRKKIVLDIDDVVSGSLYDSIYAIPTKYSIKRWIDFRLLIAYQKKCIRRFGNILFTSREDKESILKNEKKNVHIIPNLVDGKWVGDYIPDDGFPNGNRLLFVGTLNYKPNIDGLEWFLNHIFPNFRSKFRDATLTVVGRDPEKKVYNLVKVPGVKLYPNVPDILPYYKKCRVVVAPLLSGGGTRIKIMEATLANRPVLSTTIGASGLGFEDGKNILYFHDSKSFIAKYEKLIDQNFYSKIVEIARNDTKSKNSVETFHMKMKEILSGIL